MATGASRMRTLLDDDDDLAPPLDTGLAGVVPIIVNRAPVLTLWAAVVAERLGHPADTALTLGRAVAGFAARVKARSIGREEPKTNRDADAPGPQPRPATKPAILLGKNILLLPTADGELRAAEGGQPADPVAVQRYLVKAFGEHLPEVRAAMEELAGRYEPAELNRIGFRLYETFRPEIPPGNKGWGARAALQVDKIVAATRVQAPPNNILRRRFC